MSNKPAKTLRYRNIKAVIWRNEGENGPWYSVEFVRTYKDGETYKDSSSFSGEQLLVIQHLAGQAFGAVAKLEAEDREAAEQRKAA